MVFSLSNKVKDFFRYFLKYLLLGPKKSFVDPPLETTALVRYHCQLADVFNISIFRSKCEEGKGKIQLIVPNFFKLVPQICLLPRRWRIIDVLKQLYLKVPFVINRD